MTKYIVKLTEAEELALQQLAVHPGFPVIFKLLQGESLDAQTRAMECVGNSEERLLKLSDAQATVRVVNALTRRLAAYQEILTPTVEEEITETMDFNIFDKRSN